MHLSSASSKTTPIHSSTSVSNLISQISFFSTLPPPPSKKGMISSTIDSISHSATSKLETRRVDKAAKDFQKSLLSLTGLPGQTSATFSMVDYAQSLTDGAAEAFGWKGKIPGFSDKEQIEAMKRNISVAKGLGDVLDETYSDNESTPANWSEILSDRKPIPVKVRLQAQLKVTPAATTAEVSERSERALRKTLPK